MAASVPHSAGVNGATKRNPDHGQVKLLPCNSTDATQQWTKKAEAGGTVVPDDDEAVPAGSFSLKQQSQCLDLQQGEYNMERCSCNSGPNQLFRYNATTGALSFAKGAKGRKAVIDVC